MAVANSNRLLEFEMETKLSVCNVFPSRSGLCLLFALLVVVSRGFSV